VFASGFDLRSACAVAGSDDTDDYAVLDLLDALVRKSLLVADRRSGRTRCSMLETIRQFAEDELVGSGAAEQVRAAHAHHFACCETDVMTLWDSPRQREAYDWFGVELANLRTAFRWAADQSDLDAATGIAGYAGLLGYLVENYEPIAWAQELVDPAHDVDHPRLALLYAIASLSYISGRIEAAVRYSDAGRPVLESDRAAVPYGIRAMLGGTYMYVGQNERTIDWCQAELARGGDTHACARTGVVIALSVAGRRDEAMAIADGLTEAAEATNNPWSMSYSLLAFGLAV
jgi:hypothetical protein